MNRGTNILDSLNRSYFWDINTSSGKKFSKRLIIDRVFSLGTLDEVRGIIDYFGEDATIEVLRDLNYIDPKTFNFVSKYFRKSKKEFKCYGLYKKQVVRVTK